MYNCVKRKRGSTSSREGFVSRRMSLLQGRCILVPVARLMHDMSAVAMRRTEKGCESRNAGSRREEEEVAGPY